MVCIGQIPSLVKNATKEKINGKITDVTFRALGVVKGVDQLAMDQI